AAYAGVLLTTLDDARQLGLAADDAAASLDQLARRLELAHLKQRVVSDLTHVVDAAMAASIAQLGLDAASDAAAVAARAGLRAATAELKAIISDAVARVAADLATRTGRVAAVRVLRRFALPRLATAAATSAGVQLAFVHRIDPGEAAQDAALGLLFPGHPGRQLALAARLPRILTVLPRGLDLTLHEAAGGHTLRRHVGKDITYLVEVRLASSTAKGLAGTFASVKDAGAALRWCLTRNVDVLERWYASGASHTQLTAPLLRRTTARIVRRDPHTGLVRELRRSEVDRVVVRLLRRGDEVVVTTVFPSTTRYSTTGAPRG
ncbi:MAG TPA: RNase A-like domain-containing protein, partial [Mycobacteriales bacterium]|nr:RNase A-like domain-containing protein [Mycobacteriales bacterium]